MKTKKPNVELVWKQLDDLLVPRLGLGPIDRAAYCYLLRHSRLEGKLRLSFSLSWLAHGVRFSRNLARKAVRRLVERGALRLVERTKAGHVVQVRLPEEILADHAEETASRPATHTALAVNLEEKDFLRTKTLRHAIHAREAGRCFYCLRRLTPQVRSLDHVVPQTESRHNSYRNLVSCCLDCNSKKGEGRADDFLRSLFRDRKLTESELAGRLRALDALAVGKLLPPLPSDPIPARGSPAVSERPTLGCSSSSQAAHGQLRRE